MKKMDRTAVLDFLITEYAHVPFVSNMYFEGHGALPRVFKDLSGQSGGRRVAIVRWLDFW